MIQVNGESRKVIRMACGTRYRHTPVINSLPCGYQPYSWEGVTLTRDQLKAVVRKHYLEGK